MKKYEKIFDKKIEKIIHENYLKERERQKQLLNKKKKYDKRLSLLAILYLLLIVTLITDFLGFSGMIISYVLIYIAFKLGGIYEFNK